MWYFALDCMKLLYIFIAWRLFLRGLGDDLLMRKWQPMYITAVYQDYWGLMELLYVYFYVLQPWIVRPMTVQCVYFWVNYSGRLYNLNEEINMKYTVSFLLNTHRVIWLSYKMYTREANPTKVEKMKTMSIMKRESGFAVNFVKVTFQERGKR